MQLGLMAQNKDSAAQAHHKVYIVTIIKRVELTQKTIEIKMSMWEKMGDGTAKDRLFESIQELFEKSEGLQTQLQDIGLEEWVSSPIVLNILSNVSSSMGLSGGKTSGVDKIVDLL
jgi:hypothetical protein